MKRTGAMTEPELIVKTFVLGYNEAPKSLNEGGVGSRRHWSAGHAEKKKWENIYGMLLLGSKAPRGMAYCKVKATLQFRDHRRRDVDNYRPAISKPLADVLVKGGWLPDDTAEFFQLESVEINKEPLVNPNTSVKGSITLLIGAAYVP
jgi:Holliday junction resolvase RusA-like endonuclease